MRVLLKRVTGGLSLGRATARVGATRTSLRRSRLPTFREGSHDPIRVRMSACLESNGRMLSLAGSGLLGCVSGGIGCPPSTPARDDEDGLGAMPATLQTPNYTQLNPITPT